MGRRAIPREAILDNLRQVARALGKKVLTCEDYKSHPLRRFCLASIMRKCQSWTNALQAIGLAPAHVHRKARGNPSSPRKRAPRTGFPLKARGNDERSDGGCPRCCGLFELASVLDEHGSPMQLWRCVNCGEVLDAKILENRQLHQPKEKRLLGQWPPAPSSRYAGSSGLSRFSGANQEPNKLNKPYKPKKPHNPLRHAPTGPAA